MDVQPAYHSGSGYAGGVILKYAAVIGGAYDPVLEYHGWRLMVVNLEVSINTKVF
jgi:hypothetical protein